MLAVNFTHNIVLHLNWFQGGILTIDFLWNKNRLNRLFVAYQIHRYGLAAVYYSGNSLSCKWDLTAIQLCLLCFSLRLDSSSKKAAAFMELRNPCLPEARSTLSYREFFFLRDCFWVEKLTGVMARMFRGMNYKCGI